MKYIKLYENFDIDSIKRELSKYKNRITDYTINEDGTIDVFGSAVLTSLDFTKLPFKFGRVTGNFNISSNQLTSLEGCPYYVGGEFRCRSNRLTNLIGGPEEVGKDYSCYDNQLTTLEGVAAEIGGGFFCQRNKLTDLNISSNIVGNILCWENKIDPENYHFYGDVGGKIKFK